VKKEERSPAEIIEMFRFCPLQGMEPLRYFEQGQGDDMFRYGPSDDQLKDVTEVKQLE
jgi:hypothetical protein